MKFEQQSYYLSKKNNDDNSITIHIWYASGCSQFVNDTEHSVGH